MTLYVVNTVIIVETTLNDKKSITANSTSCSVCHNGYSNIITDSESGEVICVNCGMVITEKSEDITNPEWRAFTTEEQNKKVRTGAPTSLARHDMGLSTIIGRENKDASGQIIDTTMRSKIERLRIWDHRTLFHTSGDRNFMKAFGQLDRLKEKLGLSDTIIEKAAYTYRKVQERGLIKGRTIDSMLAASVYSACREMETPRTIKDIAAISNVNRKDIARSYRLLIFELGIRIPVVNPMKCIVKVANKANLSEKVTRQAMSVMKQIIQGGISAGKNPMSLAATVLYVSSFKSGEKNITQLDIAKAAGVTEVTLRNRINELNSKVW